MSRTRRYPLEIQDEELETVLKELEVAGVDYYQEGSVLLLREPERPEYEVVYQKHNDMWFWVDRAAIVESRKAFHDKSRESQADEFMRAVYSHGLSEFNKSYNEELSKLKEIE